MKEGRSFFFQLTAWMDYFANHWDDMNVDSVAVELSKNSTRASFHNTFLDFRRFSSIIILELIHSQDGSLKEINNIDIEKKINELVKTDLIFLKKCSN